MFTAFYDNGANLEDITRYIKRMGADEKAITLDTDKYLYLASFLKFNHAYIALSTKAITSHNIKIELFDGKDTWNEVAHSVDETDGLNDDGIIEFTPDLDENWASASTEDITELESIKIYNRYWVRISFDATTDATVKYIGHKFSDDLDLFEEYAELNNSSFLSYFGATDYDKQSIKAAEIMEKDLIDLGRAQAIEQVLTVESLKLASVCKVAEIVYGQFGDEYRDATAEIRKEYRDRLRKAVPVLDVNNNAEKSTNFKASVTHGVLRR